MPTPTTTAEDQGGDAHGGVAQIADVAGIGRTEENDRQLDGAAQSIGARIV